MDWNDYKWPCLVASLMVFECFMIGGMLVGRARNKAFPKGWMEQNFQEEHAKFFTEEATKTVNKNAYPDVGSGRYSEKLSYKDWYEFNTA